jgi:hypothetical protein
MTTTATQDLTITLLVDQTLAAVFQAINHPRGWWQGEIEGSTDKVGDTFTYQMKEMHLSTQRVVEQVPDKRIVWLVTDSQLNFLQDKSEWTGTKIIFEIASVNGKTEIRFTHEGLYPQCECYGACSNGWSLLLQESLVSLLTTGKGKEVF